MKLLRAATAGLAIILCASAEIIKVKNDKTEATQYPLQMAIDQAKPGDTVLMEPGMYFEDVQSNRDGEMDAPIIIKGPASAVLRGKSGQRIVLINHDHIHLEGFSIDGSGNQEQQKNLDPDSYHDHLIHVHGNRVRSVKYGDHTHRAGVTGFKAADLSLSHAGSTCMKLSYFVTHSEVVGNSIANCGQSVLKCADDINGCGRGLDVGTTLSKRMEGIGGEVDESSWNSIKDNSFSNISGACLILHEGVRANHVHSNNCIGSRDDRGAGLIVRGDANIVSRNVITGGAGAGIGIGGTKAESHQYGVFNQIYQNQLASNEKGALLDGEVPSPSGIVCENGIDDNASPQLAKECPKTLQSMFGGDGGFFSVGSGAGTRAGPGLPGLNESKGQRNSAFAGDYTCHPVPLTPDEVISITSEKVEGSEVGSEDGEKVVDQDPETRWVRQGLNQWLEFDVMSAAGCPSIQAISIHFYKGDARVAFFQVIADGKEVVSEGVSTGTEDTPEVFMFDEEVKARKVRFIGLGSKVRDEEDGSMPFTHWNAINTIELCQGTPVHGECDT